MAASWRKIPFLRWSFWRLVFGMKHLHNAVGGGDGREARLAEYVLAHARHGDAADAIRVIDEFGCNQSILINVGDEKGRILDAAMAKARPARVLELGTYCGYRRLKRSPRPLRKSSRSNSMRRTPRSPAVFLTTQAWAGG